MRTRLQAADMAAVGEACGLAGLTECLFSGRLHPRVIGATQPVSRRTDNYSDAGGSGPTRCHVRVRPVGTMGYPEQRVERT